MGEPLHHGRLSGSKRFRGTVKQAETSTSGTVGSCTESNGQGMGNTTRRQPKSVASPTLTKILEQGKNYWK